VINGYSELLQLEIREPREVLDMVMSIGEAGEQAAGLTRQLLAFSRRAVLEPKVLDLNNVVRETERMLRRVIGEDIKLDTVLAPDLWHVRVDAGQTAQVLMNLVVNARDAMPQGGSLTLQTANLAVDARLAGLKADLSEGDYVLFTVHDTGHGMSADVKAHLFEPFFTTKPPGEGTGLGLATVYGIVRQSGGHVDVYSEVGVGTTFKIYLPAIHAAADAISGNAAPTSGTETILLVEDEDRVREMASVALKGYGYTVVGVCNGADALAILADPSARVDLVVTDVIMPEMSGPEMAAQAVELRPGLPCLFVSGYTDDTVVRHGILEAEMEFLQKPYTPRSLARKVREVLDRESQGGP
jgi:CheY-like chemotaxis protein